MTTYAGKPSAKARLYELWDCGDERNDGELAREVGCSSTTVKVYRSDYRREHSRWLAIREKVISDVIGLYNEELDFDEIADYVNEHYDVDVSGDYVKNLYHQAARYLRTPKVVEVSESELPLKTFAGTMFVTPQRVTGKCKECAWYEICRLCVWRGNFVACEGLLRQEVIGDG